ncbi:nuclear transport factor 2 family protein, partial [Streptomyces goshikiensis]|uniref:nuclear transport factor 2 family protein n=1 Tax=Streptomyces goshikiensis TaxID=1942 RepID=UPI0036D0A237
VSGSAGAVAAGVGGEHGALYPRAGRAHSRGGGGAAPPPRQVADWLAETMRMFPVRQHLIVNRLIRLEDLGGSPGDSAEVRADFVNPMRLTGTGTDDAGDAGGMPNFVAAGRYTFALARTGEGWRLSRVTVHEKWRHLSS